MTDTFEPMTSPPVDINEGSGAVGIFLRAAASAAEGVADEMPGLLVTDWTEVEVQEAYLDLGESG